MASKVKVEKMTIGDVLRLMAFYKATQPTVRTGRLLKIAGFKIAGLAGTSLAKLQSLGHKLAWHDDLAAGICTCGRWQSENVWNRDISLHQHQIHARKVQMA